jgi:2-keto-4-pentenoate hydratase
MGPMSAPSPLTSQLESDFSDALLQARRTATPIAPLTDALPSLSAAEAYAIARRGVDADLAAGARIVGHKIGLTAVAVQQQLGVDTPDYGALLNTMEIADGAILDASRYIAARVELEIAFRLAEPLAGPGITADDVRAATGTVQAAVELVDSRIADWRITLADTIADRASSAGFIIGGPRFTLEEIDVRGVDVELYRNGDLVERGRSDAVLGDPCVAVAWLANALGELGEILEVDEVILSGACTKMVSIAPGDEYRATFAGFGELTLGVKP